MKIIIICNSKYLVLTDEIFCINIFPIEKLNTKII